MSTMSNDNVINLRWRPQVGFDARLRLVRLDYADRIGQRITMDRMADELSVPRGTYRAWEAGNSKPQDLIAMARRIHEVTGVDPAWLLDVADDGPSGPNRTPEHVGSPSTWMHVSPDDVIHVDFGGRELVGAAA